VRQRLAEERPDLSAIICASHTPVSNFVQTAAVNRPTLHSYRDAEHKASRSQEGSMSFEEFRQYAAECTRWAAEAETEEERNAFLDMARAWIQAALRFQGVMSPDSTNRITATAVLH
jgi:hypothetical protein